MIYSIYACNQNFIIDQMSLYYCVTGGGRTQQQKGNYQELGTNKLRDNNQITRETQHTRKDTGKETTQQQADEDRRLRYSQDNERMGNRRKHTGTNTD